MAPKRYEKWISGDGLTKVGGWARDGLTLDEIAHNIGISRASLYKWMDRFPEFAKAINKGREVVDIQVENALLKKALGYDYTEEIKERKHINGKPQMVVTRVVTKHVPPDTTAQIFWLKNRRPDRWKEKQSLELSSQKDDMERMDEILEQMGMLDEQADSVPEV